MKKFFTLAAAAFLSVSAYAGLTEYDLVPQSWTPADGATIDLTVQGASFAFSANLGQGVTPIEGAHGTLTCAEADYTSEVTIKDFVMGGVSYGTIVNFDESTITKSGVYVLDVPEGQWGDADFIAGNGGHANKAFKYTYTVIVPEVVGPKTCEILSIDPADGASFAGFEAGSTITINTTDNTAVGYYTIEITDLNPINPDEAIMRTTYGKHNYAAGPIVYTFGNLGLEFLQGHDYKVDIVLTNADDWQGPTTPIAATGTYTWKGTAAGYEYSPVKNTAIMPTPDEYTIEDLPFHFTMTFDGWVDIDLEQSILYNGGMQDGTKIPAENVTYNEDHTEVTILVPDSYLESCGQEAGISVFVKDKEGRYLYWGSDLKEQSYKMIMYPCAIGLPELTILPAAGEVTELSSFIITCDANDGVLNYSYLPETAQVVTPTGDRWELAAPVISNTKGSGANEKPIEWTLTLDEPITAPGRYILIIPSGYFTSGEEFSAISTKRANVEYEIANIPVGDLTYNVNATNATLNATPDKYEVLIKWDVEAANGDPRVNNYVTDADGNIVAENLDSAYSFDDYSVWGFGVPATALEAGKTYTLHVPQGSVGDDKAVNSDFTEGRVNVPVEVNFTTTEVLDVKNLQPAVITYSFPEPENVEASVAHTEFTVTFTYPEGTTININDTMYEYPAVIGGVQVLDPEGLPAQLTKLEARARANTLIFTFAGINDVDTREYTLVLGKGFIGDDTYAESNYTSGAANAEYHYDFTPLKLTYSGVSFDITPDGYDIIRNWTCDPNYATFLYSMDVNFRFSYDKYGAINLEPTGRYRKDCVGLGCKVLDQNGEEVKTYVYVYPDGKEEIRNVSITAEYDPWNIEVTTFRVYGLDRKSTETYTLYIPYNIMGDLAWWNSGTTGGRAVPEQYIEIVPANATPIQDTFAEGELKPITLPDKNVTTSITDMLNGGKDVYIEMLFPIDIIYAGNFSDPNNYNDTFVTVTNTETGEPVEAGDISFNSPFDNVKMATIDISQCEAFAKGGEFDITINQGLIGDATYMFFSNFTKGRVNATRVIHISTGAVDNVAVDAEAANKDVYNLQGVLILENATPAQVQALPAGLYIVGGEKVVIR